ncbi:hypothetical protein, partial [Escherichia coli]
MNKLQSYFIASVLYVMTPHADESPND